MSEKVNQKYERKFVVLLPDIRELANHYIISTIDITQTFLRNYNRDGDCHVRIEKTNGTVKYFYSRKVCERERGLRIIAEDYEIGKEEYEQLVKTRIHPMASIIKKTRFVFEYREQIFNLDVLRDEIVNSDGKIMLSDKHGIVMIELPFPDEQLEWPRYIFLEQEIGEHGEITNDMSYTTKSLAKQLKRREDEKKNGDN